MTPTITLQFFLNGCGSHFVFNGLIPKGNQIIRNTTAILENDRLWLGARKKYIG